MNNMEPRRHRSFGPQIVAGVAVVALGMMLTANNLGMGQFGFAVRFWPLVFTVLGIAVLLQEGGSSSRRFFGVVLIIGGLWQTANEAFGFRVYIDDYWPLLLVGFGVMLVLRSLRDRPAGAEDYTAVGGGFSTSGPDLGGAPPASAPLGSAATADAGGRDQRINAFAFMGGVRRNVVSPAFRRANLTAIMGGVVLDLRQCAAAGGETIVEMFAFMGGLEVRVPPDWQVVNEVTPIMGGVDDRSANTQPTRHRLILRGVVFMGGVEVKS